LPQAVAANNINYSQIKGGTMKRSTTVTSSHKQIYTKYVHRYEDLTSRSDYQQNILRAINEIRPLRGVDVIELGAGTGRLTCKLAPAVKSIYAFDISQHMLDVAVTKLEERELHNWRVGVADNRDLPVDNRVADIAISGWSICYTVLWHEKTWQKELRKALAEMRRVLRPGGTIILLESLGTGYQMPRPLKSLGTYYEFLEKEGFLSTWIRTDYRFDSMKEAEALTSFFFGADKVAKIINEKLVVLPEYTGIWWLSV
jgi:ubiquinone/menaquinone biosynthesis C-methylase UbiE